MKPLFPIRAYTRAELQAFIEQMLVDPSSGPFSIEQIHQELERRNFIKEPELKSK